MRKILTALLCSIVFVAGINYTAIADYLATAGSGLTFGSVDLAGIKFPAFLVCDFTTAKQCAAVKAASTAAAQTDPAVVDRNPDVGTIGDVAWTSGNGTVIAILKAIVGAINSAIAAGTNMIGFVGLQANTTGGCTPTHVLSAASTNSTNIKASAGTVCSITIVQNTATAADFRFYDSASAPTCSSGTGVVANYGVQANTSSPGLSPNLGPFGLLFSTGIGFCLTAYDGTDTNNSNSVTGIQIDIAYK